MLFITTALLISLPGFAVAEPASHKKANILIVGDSLSAAYGIDISQSWVSLLQNRLTAKSYNYTTINASISGDTTQSGLARLPAALQKHQPAIVIISLGGNDGLRGLPLNLSHSNLNAMIKLAKQAKAKVVLCGVRLPPNLGPVYNKKFQSMFQQLAIINHIGLVPELMKNVSDNAQMLQADGIHPKVAGQPIILENVWTVLKSQL